MGIERYFAVTVSGSVWEIRCERDSDQIPIVQKIAGRGDTKEVAVKGRLWMANDHVFHQGDVMVALTHDLGVILFCPEHGKQLRQLPRSRCSLKRTGELVALFTSERAAKRCATAPNIAALDERWKHKLRKTLKKIGFDHPMVLIDRELRQRLFPEKLTRQRG